MLTTQKLHRAINTLHMVNVATSRVALGTVGIATKSAIIRNTPPKVGGGMAIIAIIAIIQNTDFTCKNIKAITAIIAIILNTPPNLGGGIDLRVSTAVVTPKMRYERYPSAISCTLAVSKILYTRR